jgi:hypothetical protein
VKPLNFYPRPVLFIEGGFFVAHGRPVPLASLWLVKTLQVSSTVEGVFSTMEARNSTEKVVNSTIRK